MPQKISPFLEGKFGWEVGESGWNSGMDENLLKFSYLFDRNVDAVVSTLPSNPTNGQAYFLTTDNRLYFRVSGAWYSSPLPKWFKFQLKSTGEVYQFNGYTASLVSSASEVDSRFEAVEMTLNSLGSAAFMDSEDFATADQLSLVGAYSQAYTDDFKNSLLSPTGTNLVGYGDTTLTEALSRIGKGRVSVLDYGAVGDGVSEDSSAINSAITDNPGKQVYVPDGVYRVDNPIYVLSGTRLVMSKGAVFRRNSTYTSNTTPVVYVLDISSELRGGTIQTDNNSPDGAVVIGHASPTDNRNSWYWRVCDLDILGNNSPGSVGWVIPSGQVTYPLDANYFGTIDKINTKGFDIGAILLENANAHNISNLHFWLCKVANIRLRGAYANNFTNMFFHGGAANGCIGIQLLNKTTGPYTSSEHNKFIGFSCETGGSLDQAFYIDTDCVGNTLIGATNVAGGYTILNADNNIQLNGYGSASYTSLPGEASKIDSVVAGTTTPITPPGFLSINQSGSFLITVNVYNNANANLNRTDLVLVSLRNSSFAPSSVVLVSSAFTAAGVSGEPTSVAYDVSFTDGPAAPRMTANITATAGTTFTVKAKIFRA